MRIGSPLLFVLIATQVSTASAQGVTVLNPTPRQYALRGFTYRPPAGDGWRETSSSPTLFQIVYAKRIDEKTINTQAQVTGQAFVISQPSKVSNAQSLAELSRRQQIEKRKENLVAFSKLQRVPGDKEILNFTLVSKLGEKQAFESFYVVLAPDKSEYLVLRLITTEKDYKNRPYYAAFYGTLASIAFQGVQEKPAVPGS